MSISIEEVRPDSEAAAQLINELDAYLETLPYPQESRHAYSIDKLLREGVFIFLTSVDGRPAACGGIKLFPEYGEVKRMYVRPAFRGLGLGKGMLDHLANYSREQQRTILRLETGIYQVEAIGLYERYGFRRRTPFGEYKTDPMSIYYEKKID